MQFELDAPFLILYPVSLISTNVLQLLIELYNIVRKINFKYKGMHMKYMTNYEVK